MAGGRGTGSGYLAQRWLLLLSSDTELVLLQLSDPECPLGITPVRIFISCLGLFACKLVYHAIGRVAGAGRALPPLASLMPAAVQSSPKLKVVVVTGERCAELYGAACGDALRCQRREGVAA